jgi:hypothetical protein
VLMVVQRGQTGAAVALVVFVGIGYAGM